MLFGGGTRDKIATADASKCPVSYVLRVGRSLIMLKPHNKFSIKRMQNIVKYF